MSRIDRDKNRARCAFGVRQQFGDLLTLEDGKLCLPENWYEQRPDLADLWWSLTIEFEQEIKAILQVESEFSDDLRIPGLRKCESPIERQFFIAAYERIPALTPQVTVGPYRVDFAIVDRRIAVEVDGHEFHHTREQRTADAQRQRWLSSEGWHLVRFTGSEVYADADACVSELERILAVKE